MSKKNIKYIYFKKLLNKLDIHILNLILKIIYKTKNKYL